MKVIYYVKGKKQKSNNKLGFTHLTQIGIRRLSSIYSELQELKHKTHDDIFNNLKSLKVKIGSDLDYVEMIEDYILKRNEKEILSKT